VLSAPSLQQVQECLRPSDHGRLYALDLETRGRDPSLPTSDIVGIGLANEEGCWYFDLRGASDATRKYIRGFLRRVRLIAFNVLFDGAFLRRWTGEWLAWEGCAYGLFKYMSSEGYVGQEWNLEFAQAHVLGWEWSNKPILGAALKERGLTEAEMWKLPPEILGPYCAMDADAAWQLWQVLTEECQTQDFPHLLKFHKREFLTLLELLVEQQARGMEVDAEQLHAHHADLVRRIDHAMSAFLNHPLVAHHIGAYNEEVRAAWKAAEPPRLTKAGEVSKNWEKWVAREHVWMRDKSFNPNSKQQLGWLLYDKVFKVVKEGSKSVTVLIDGKKYEVDKTEGGQRSVKKQILPLFGEVGLLLATYNKLVKEEGYVRAAIALRQRRPTIHPEFNSVGTITGRPAAGGEVLD
jgi:hypothetical protein